ncbi:MAG: FeoB-associated Cys-rich membrane protein [Denitrovibrio sp.]|nr:MAG: FeoB-associated Cys-rich membrane protein [Denitrovibrio sp.]
MQFLIVFIICLAFMALYMFVLRKKQTSGSCGCGQGKCQTGETCDNTDKEENGI